MIYPRFTWVFGKKSKSDKSIDENDAKKLVAYFTKSNFGHINGDKYVKISPISRFSPLSTMSMLRNLYIVVLPGFSQKNQNDAKKLVAYCKMMRNVGKSDFGHINGDKYVKMGPSSSFSPLSTMSMVRN